MERLRCEVFFPVHDVGVDLLVVKGLKHVGVQVKESRYFFRRRRSGQVLGHSWHQVKRTKLLKRKVDFYVFLTYMPVVGEHKISRFDNKFLIVPSSELEERMVAKDAGKRQIYSFYFHFDCAKVWDERVVVEAGNPLTDYTEFLDAWDLIRKRIE